MTKGEIGEKALCSLKWLLRMILREPCTHIVKIHCKCKGCPFFITAGAAIHCKRPQSRRLRTQQPPMMPTEGKQICRRDADGSGGEPRRVCELDIILVISYFNTNSCLTHSFCGTVGQSRTEIGNQHHFRAGWQPELSPSLN